MPTTLEENHAWPQYLATFTALISLFCAGIHFGWPSPSLPRILSDEYPFDVTLEEASYITIIGPFGDIVGNIVSSLVVDVIGRKPAILLISVPQILSYVSIYLSFYSKSLLYVARFSGGVSEGACFTILPIYICEISEPQVRGVLGSSFSLVLTLGVLFINIIGTVWTIHATALISLALILVFVAAFSTQAESPYFLIMKNRVEDARRSLRKLRGGQNVEDELSSLIKDVERQMSERGSFKDLLAIESNKMATIAMVVLRLLQHYSGFGSFNFYAQLLFGQVTDVIAADAAAMLMIAVQLLFAVVATVTVDHVGRKPLVLLSIGGCCFSLVSNGIFFVLRDTGAVDVSGLTVLPLLGLLLFVVSFAMGLGSVVNLMAGEIFPASIKAKAMCVMNVVFSFGMLTSVKFYQFTSENFGLAVPFLVFGVCQFCGFVLSWRFVPETKNKSLEEIQQELKGKVK